jgi:hypothetical protein
LRSICIPILALHECVLLYHLAAGLLTVIIVIHTIQALYYRAWWFFPTTVIAGIAEVVGWSGRLRSSFDPIALTPFLVQQVNLHIFNSAHKFDRFFLQNYHHHHRTNSTRRYKFYYSWSSHQQARKTVQSFESKMV